MLFYNTTIAKNKVFYVKLFVQFGLQNLFIQNFMISMCIHNIYTHIHISHRIGLRLGLYLPAPLHYDGVFNSL